jgi:hypothetical protein
VDGGAGLISSQFTSTAVERHRGELSEFVASSPEDRLALLQIVTPNAAPGCADLHATTVSSLIAADGIGLAPLYDPVPTLFWPNAARAPGFSIGGQHHLDDPGADHVVGEGVAWGLGCSACHDLARRSPSAYAAGVEEALVESCADGWCNPQLDAMAHRVAVESRRTLSRRHRAQR